MTLLAGVFSRHVRDSLPDSLCDSVQQALSRHPGERVERFRDTRCFLAKADVGAFDSPARVVAPDGATFVVGEPLLTNTEQLARPRAADVEEIHAALMRGDDAPLSRARGVFCAAHYRHDSGTLVLVADKLAIRPMYYWIDERYVVFATALRILEQIPEVPKVMDLRGVTELSAFGYALADRTPFESIRLMLPAEVVTVRDGDEAHRTYWSWDALKASTRPVEELAARSYEVFSEAVALRNRGDTSSVAFLSGGLDSRAIATALVDRGVNLRTFNFAIPGTQDQVFAAEFAARAGVTHVESPVLPRNPAWSMLMARALEDAPAVAGPPPERPGVVWSGDGGSVSLGHVYMDASMVGLARAGQRDALVEAMNRSWGAEVPRYLIRPSMVEKLSGVTRRGLSEELTRIGSCDAGRALYLLLMYNDQRRHLAQHFEGIDLHRLEFELPFFDSDFVASVIEVPVDACLGHEFYMKWLRHFPGVITSVPWQAYPGHFPCPLPIPPEIGYQWELAQSRSLGDAYKRDLIEQAGTMLRAEDFPHRLMSRSFLRLATWLYRLSVRDLAHVIRTAATYYRYGSAGAFERERVG